LLKGKYLNPKYAIRRRKLRQAVLVTCVLTLLIVGVGTVWQVDANIRGSMLPAAPPVATVERAEPMQYHIHFFGQEYYLSLQGAVGVATQFSELLRTQPAPVRLCYQLRAYLTHMLPKNLRDNPRNAYEG